MGEVKIIKQSRVLLKDGPVILSLAEFPDAEPDVRYTCSVRFEWEEPDWADGTDRDDAGWDYDHWLWVLLEYAGGVLEEYKEAERA